MKDVIYRIRSVSRSYHLIFPVKGNSVNSKFGFPKRLARYPSDNDYHWELVEELYARLRVGQGESFPDEINRIGANTVICRATESSEQEVQYENDCAPVYRLGSSGQTCVATGLIFVTLNDGCTFADSHDSLQEAGFTIEKQSGSIELALNSYSLLSQLEAIRTSEPQILLRLSSKGRRKRF